MKEKRELLYKNQKMGYVIVLVFNKEIEVLKGGTGDRLLASRLKAWASPILFFKATLRKEMSIYIRSNSNPIPSTSKSRLKIFSDFHHIICHHVYAVDLSFTSSSTFDPG